MDDIKRAFFETAIKSLDDEERMNDYQKQEIAQFRWERFVNHLVNDGAGLNYANGNWY